jgi:hypothetical protein
MPAEDKVDEQLVSDYSLILLTSAAVGERDSQITAWVPFAFHVGSSKFAAGEQKLETDVVTGMLFLKAVHSGSFVMIPCFAVSSPYAPALNTLVFTKYMDEYFLFQVWKAGAKVGCELRKSQHEIEVANHAFKACRSNVDAG